MDERAIALEDARQRGDVPFVVAQLLPHRRQPAGALHDDLVSAGLRAESIARPGDEPVLRKQREVHVLPRDDDVRHHAIASIGVSLSRAFL